MLTRNLNLTSVHGSMRSWISTTSTMSKVLKNVPATCRDAYIAMSHDSDGGYVDSATYLTLITDNDPTSRGSDLIRQ